jgi:hypothetical protein
MSLMWFLACLIATTSRSQEHRGLHALLSFSGGDHRNGGGNIRFILRARVVLHMAAGPFKLLPLRISHSTCL